MRLTIDTKHDSPEEIKHAIQILTSLLEKRGTSVPAKPDTANITGKPSTIDTANLMSMFNTSAEPQREEESASLGMSDSTVANTARKEVPDTAPDFTSFLNLANREKEEPKEEPKIEFF
jgi:uncharacterized protein YccT (UPF0319 family)